MGNKIRRKRGKWEKDMKKGDHKVDWTEEGRYVGLTERKQTDINLIELRVGRTCQSAMVDTGAQISCMSFAVFKRSGLSQQFELQTPDIEYILGVSGIPVKVMGTAVLPLTICKLEIQQKFYIFEKFRQPIILGVDFLTGQRAKFDFQNYRLEIQGGITAAIMFSNPQKLSLARTVNRISIPSKTAVVTKVRVKKPSSRKMSLVEPVQSLASKHCIMGARSISEVHKGFVYVKLLNPTSTDIEIKPNEPIARLHPCDEQDLCKEYEEESLFKASINTVGLETCDSDKPQPSDEDYIHVAHTMGVDLSQSDLTDKQKHELLVLL
ncbi:MAG: retropepsin-like domain-containing protein, partial [Candidatus Thiodiazotropha endolucinida]|nr:retropepsin-like domain-containing protein [Candidatus Thiodiazotropha taylori]MCW4344231.1 retropepsin-like domain-containing protein [Candidatus Thiodiazotropha endolucinida]